MNVLREALSYLLSAALVWAVAIFLIYLVWRLASALMPEAAAALTSFGCFLSFSGAIIFAVVKAYKAM